MIWLWRRKVNHALFDKRTYCSMSLLTLLNHWQFIDAQLNYIRMLFMCPLNTIHKVWVAYKCMYTKFREMKPCTCPYVFVYNRLKWVHVSMCRRERGVFACFGLAYMYKTFRKVMFHFVKNICSAWLTWHKVCTTTVFMFSGVHYIQSLQILRYLLYMV